MKSLFSLVALLAWMAPAGAHHSGRHTVATATVYHSWYSGRTTACGNAYRHWGVSAAHPYLPCGTRIRISHEGRTLTVPVRDRCNCDVDLSAGAAHRLGVPIDGIARVRVSY